MSVIVADKQPLNVPPAPVAVIKTRSLWQDAWIRFKRNKAALVSGLILLLITVFVFVAPMVSQFNYSDADWGAIGSRPSLSSGHYFGTDGLGRDLMVRVAKGGQISLAVGVVSATVAMIFGTIYGAFSGFIGGKVDALMMRTIDILSAIPFMFLVILMTTFFGRDLFLMFVALGMLSWLDVARMVRGQTMSLKQKEFIEAAHVGGVSKWKTVTKHIIPNVLGLVVIQASLMVPGMILAESFLSFLGLGVQEPMTSWGALLQEGARTMEVSPYQLMIPATFMVLTLFCFNFLGDGLRDALDPKDR